MSDSDITLTDVMRAIASSRAVTDERFDKLEVVNAQRFDKIENEIKDLREVVELAWKAHGEDITALSDDIMEVKKFVGMPLPAID